MPLIHPPSLPSQQYHYENTEFAPIVTLLRAVRENATRTLLEAVRWLNNNSSLGTYTTLSVSSDPLVNT